MLGAFGLSEPGLGALAEIVHAIDLRDGAATHPEIAGVDAVLQGWLHADLSDDERERAGIALFEGLYQALSRAATSVAEQGSTVNQLSDPSSPDNGR